MPCNLFFKGRVHAGCEVSGQVKTQTGPRGAFPDRPRVFEPQLRLRAGAGGLLTGGGRCPQPCSINHSRQTLITVVGNVFVMKICI